MSELKPFLEELFDHLKSLKRTMPTEQAISRLKIAQEIIAPVLEDAAKLANEDFRCRVASLLDELNACSEELAEWQVMEEFLKGE